MAASGSAPMRKRESPEAGLGAAVGAGFVGSSVTGPRSEGGM